MCRSTPLSSVFAVLLTAAAATSCGSDARDPRPAEETAAAPAAQASGQLRQATHTITIGVDAQGNPTVSDDSLLVNRSSSPVVAWASGPDIGQRMWVVGFGAESPFRNSRQIFHNRAQGDRQSPISASAPLGDYKYWVFLADDRGEWTQLDPKLVILDDPGAVSDTTPR